MLGFEDEETADDILFSLPRSYGRNQSYGNSKKATKAEREELLSIIQQKKYSESGTDVYSLDANDHKIIYLVDHSSDSELYENLRKGGDGFGIRKTFEVDKITADDVRTILRNIASDYGYSAARLRNRLQALRIRPEVMSGVDIAAELEMGSGADARMDASGGGQGVSSQYNGSRPDGRESSYGLDEKGGERGRTLRGGTELSLVERDSEGKPVRKQYSATPRVVSEARRQKAFAELNKRLRRGVRFGHKPVWPGDYWPLCGLQAGSIHKNRPSAWMARPFGGFHPRKPALSVDGLGFIQGIPKKRNPRLARMIPVGCPIPRFFRTRCLKI